MNGRSATAATSPKPPWPSSTRPAILDPLPPSRRPGRQRGSVQSPPPHGTLSQPVRELRQRRHHRRTRRHLLHPPFSTARRRQTDPTHDLGLADIQRCDPLNDLLV